MDGLSTLKGTLAVKLWDPRDGPYNRVDPHPYGVVNFVNLCCTGIAPVPLKPPHLHGPDLLERGCVCVRCEDPADNCHCPHKDGLGGDGQEGGVVGAGLKARDHLGERGDSEGQGRGQGSGQGKSGANSWEGSESSTFQSKAVTLQDR